MKYGGGTTVPALPVQTLVAAVGESQEPPDPEKDKDVFKKEEEDKKKNTPVCR